MLSLGILRKMANSVKVTVFTPTYNRGYIIENLYDSLNRQTNKDFEWIVVDDGSNDNTEEIFQSIIGHENDFTIRYYKKINGGKHRAINYGVTLSAGELFYIVDSDDYLSDNAIEKVIEVERSISKAEKQYFAGVCGLRANQKGEIIGTTFNGEILDITSLEREKHQIYGDKAEVFYTEILKKFPFPEFEGENFLTECVVWDKIAYSNLKLRFFNEIIYHCEYLDDGLTKNYEKYYRENPKGYGLYIYQSRKFGKIDDYRFQNEVSKYISVNLTNLRLNEMRKNLMITWKEFLKYYFLTIDIHHLPNRTAIKLLGTERYNKLKRLIK